MIFISVLYGRSELPLTFRGFAFGREIEVESFNFVQMLNRKIIVKFCSFARLT